MKKSLESAMPCPNRFMATAAYIAGSPVFIAAGSSTAPTRGTAGLGQTSHEMIIMVMPIAQNAID
ncbi:hypothetical protein SDC9_97025 [bioreactor metagenome]|uniref:Uncharacterized protein n=1 Tax=bioreactor metagenome TaxID=1076179 RepID=A0A645ABJ6_9ZZZZ